MRPKSWPVPFGRTAISAFVPASAVHDLVHRPVAADDDEQPVAGVARGLREMAGILGEHLVAAQPELGGAAPQVGPALAGRAVARRRVDEKERLAANRT